MHHKLGIFKNPKETPKISFRWGSHFSQSRWRLLPRHFRQRYVEGFAKSQGDNAGWPHHVEFLSKIVALKKGWKWKTGQLNVDCLVYLGEWWYYIHIFGILMNYIKKNILRYFMIHYYNYNHICVCLWNETSSPTHLLSTFFKGEQKCDTFWWDKTYEINQPRSKRNVMIFLHQK